jgi:hypothetical protein
MHCFVKREVAPVSELLKSQPRIFVAVVIPVVVLIGAITKVKHLSCWPLPYIVRFIELGTREDLIEPAFTLSYYVSQLWIGEAKECAAPMIPEASSYVLGIAHE